MAKINPNIFRAYDIRGVYPRDLNEAVAARIARAFIAIYPLAKTIVVAHDTRKSSPALAMAINSALVAAGKTVIFLGTAPDPLFYFSIFYYRYDAGIMISGSHNPPEYNGLTLCIQKTSKAKQGDVILGEMEKIKKLVIDGKKLPAYDWSAEGREAKGKIVVFDPTEDYLKSVTAKIKLKRPLKILIDSGNGAMGYLPEKVFRKLGCEVKTIFGDFDGNFPNHLPDPYEEKNCFVIKKQVLQGKFDLGFAYDGDGDRVGVIDGRGRLASGDNCLFLLARQALEQYNGPIVHDVRISKAFLDEMSKKRVKTYFSVSYHSAIIKKIKQVKAVFGGEITMHFLFPKDWYLCDEGLFASLKVAQVAADQPDFARYIDTLPRYCASPEVFIPCPDDKKFQIIKKLQQYLRKNKFDFVSVDGARINFPQGWALARAANTTPFIKCRFEGKTKKDLKEIELKSLAIFQKVDIPVIKKTLEVLGLSKYKILNTKY